MNYKKGLTYKERYNIECEKSIQRCERLNRKAETITRLATPEETEHYLKLLKKDRPYAEEFHKRNPTSHYWDWEWGGDYDEY